MHTPHKAHTCDGSDASFLALPTNAMMTPGQCWYQMDALLLTLNCFWPLSDLHWHTCFWLPHCELQKCLNLCNALIQSTVINHLVYVNQMPRKDFISQKKNTLIFSSVLYKVLAPTLLRAEEQPCDVIAICLALQPQAFITGRAGQPVSSQALAMVPLTAAGRNLTTCSMKRIISCLGSEVNSPWPWMSDVGSFIKTAVLDSFFLQSHLMANMSRLLQHSFKGRSDNQLHESSNIGILSKPCNFQT